MRQEERQGESDRERRGKTCESIHRLQNFTANSMSALFMARKSLLTAALQPLLPSQHRTLAHRRPLLASSRHLEAGAFVEAERVAAFKFLNHTHTHTHTRDMAGRSLSLKRFLGPTDPPGLQIPPPSALDQ